jgi:hypothetical protein
VKENFSSVARNNFDLEVIEVTYLTKIANSLVFIKPKKAIYNLKCSTILNLSNIKFQVKYLHIYLYCKYTARRVVILFDR